MQSANRLGADSMTPKTFTSWPDCDMVRNCYTVICNCKIVVLRCFLVCKGWQTFKGTRLLGVVSFVLLVGLRWAQFKQINTLK